MNIKGVLSNWKIKYKVLFFTLLSLISILVLGLTTVFISKKNVGVLEDIYVHKVIPLNNLKEIQLIFRELEFKMVGALSDMVTGTAAVNHLKASLKQVNKLWEESRSNLNSKGIAGEVKKFEEGLNAFNSSTRNLEKAYMAIFYDEETDKMESYYEDTWLDMKPLILKSVDRIVLTQSEAVKNYYTQQQKISTKRNIMIIASQAALIPLFIGIAFLIINSISRPIETVSNAAKHVAKGDLSYKIELRSNDEMGVMANELNSMVGNLNTAFSAISDEAARIYRNAESLSGAAEYLLNGTNEQRMQVDQVVAAASDSPRQRLKWPKMHRMPLK